MIVVAWHSYFNVDVAIADLTVSHHLDSLLVCVSEVSALFDLICYLIDYIVVTLAR